MTGEESSWGASGRVLRFDVGSSRRNERLRGRGGRADRPESEALSVSKEEADENDMIDRGRGGREELAEPRAPRIAARRAWLSRPVSRGKEIALPPRTSADDAECRRARRVPMSSLAGTGASPPGPTLLIRSRPQSHQDWSALDVCLCSPQELGASLRAGDGGRSEAVGEAPPPQSDQTSDEGRGAIDPSLPLRPMSEEEGPIWRDDMLRPRGGVLSPDDSLAGRWWKDLADGRGGRTILGRIWSSVAAEALAIEVVLRRSSFCAFEAPVGGRTSGMLAS